MALAEAAEAGVGGVVCVGTDVATSRQAVELVAAIRAAAATAAGELPQGRPVSRPGRRWDFIPTRHRRGPRRSNKPSTTCSPGPTGVVVAVGECGLDYHYEHSPRATQRDAFAAQIALARRHDLTLVVHTREAWDDTLEVLAAEGVPERVVMHCFTGGPAEARRCLDIGAFLSFSGIVTFKGADDVRAAAALCPLDRLLVETDAPFSGTCPSSGSAKPPGVGRRMWGRPCRGEGRGAHDAGPNRRVVATRRAFAVALTRTSARLPQIFGHRCR